MEIEAKSHNERLNSLVAITVLIVSLFSTATRLKDDNLIRAMEYVKADSLDLWNEYQAERIKLHGDENGSKLLSLLRVQNAAAALLEQKRLQTQIAKYERQSAELSVKAKAQEARYNALKSRHEQFDTEEGILSVTLALTAVAALTELSWLLVVGWAFAVFGIVMGLAGMFGWPLHPEILTELFGRAKQKGPEFPPALCLCFEWVACPRFDTLAGRP